MIRRPIKPTVRVILGVLSALLLVAGYTWLAYRQHRENPDDRTIPGWGQLAEGLRSAVSKDNREGVRWLVVDSLASGQRLFVALFLSVVGGLTLGMLMGCFAAVEAFLAPPLSLFAKVPPTAALAVFFVLAGTGTSMYLAMIVFGILPTLAMTVYLAVKEFPDELLHKACTLGASPLEVIWNIILRQVLPRFIDAVRLSIGPALVYLIAAEMVVGDAGFGYRIRLHFKKLDMSVVYPYLVLLAGFGFGMDGFLRWLRCVVCPWYQPER